MAVETKYLPIQTNGNGDVIDLTAEIQNLLSSSNILDGILIVFTPSATSGITTLEFEPGCIKDLKRLFDEIIPPEKDYSHNKRWGDGNGHSHARAALLKPSLTIPFVERKLILGTWQSIVFVDFDNRARQRKVILQLIGE